MDLDDSRLENSNSVANMLEAPFCSDDLVGWNMGQLEDDLLEDTNGAFNSFLQSVDFLEAIDAAAADNSLPTSVAIAADQLNSEGQVYGATHKKGDGATHKKGVLTTVAESLDQSRKRNHKGESPAAKASQQKQETRRKMSPSAGRGRATRKKKPKGMPKRPMSSYNCFFQSQRIKVCEEEAARGRRVGFEELGKIIGQRWQALGDEDLEKYEALAEEDLVRYRKQMEVYETSTRPMTLQQAIQEKNAATTLDQTSVTTADDGQRSPETCGSWAKPLSPALDSARRVSPLSPRLLQVRTMRDPDPDDASLPAPGNKIFPDSKKAPLKIVIRLPSQHRTAETYGPAQVPQSPTRPPVNLEPCSPHGSPHGTTYEKRHYYSYAGNTEARAYPSYPSSPPLFQETMPPPPPPPHFHYSYPAMPPSGSSSGRLVMVPDPDTGVKRAYKITYKCYSMKRSEAEAYIARCCNGSSSNAISLDQMLQAPMPPGREVAYPFGGV